MKAFILAGGFATRLWPLTEKMAKPLLPLAGIPLLTHLVEKIPDGMNVTVSTNQVFKEDFEQWKKSRHAERNETREASRTKSKRDVNILIEDAGHEDEKLGALGAFAKWIREENINEDVLLLAGDNYVGFSLSAFIERFSGKPLLAAYDIRDLEQAKKFGVVMTESSPKTNGVFRVTGFQEKPSHPISTLVSTGCFVLPADALTAVIDFAAKHPDNIGGIFEHFMSHGMEVECVPFVDPWFDVGSFEAYLEATRALVGNNILLGEGTADRECTFEESVVFGKGSKAARSTFRNVVLFENCEIEDCVLENCIIDNDCILRGVDLTGKMVRRGTRLVR